MHGRVCCWTIIIMSFRKQHTLGYAEYSYPKPKSSEGSRRRRTFVEENSEKYDLNRRKKEMGQESKYTEIER